jgi:hypothetical protein
MAYIGMFTENAPSFLYNSYPPSTKYWFHLTYFLDAGGFSARAITLVSGIEKLLPPREEADDENPMSARMPDLPTSVVSVGDGFEGIGSIRGRQCRVD